MSYRIEYQYAAFPVDTTDGRRFVIAVEGGDNNFYVGDRRSRSWAVCMLGSASQVLRAAVYYAGCCAGGSLKPKGRDCTPESYVARIRRLVEHGDDGLHRQGAWSPAVELLIDHPGVGWLRSRGLAGVEVERCGLRRTAFDVPGDQRELVFVLMDEFPSLRAWELARVIGLPSS